MIVTTSWDDGDVLDERMADLLDRHGLKGTFYIAQTHRARTLPEPRIRTLAARHEIGAHTLRHPELPSLTRHDKVVEIEGGKKWLEDVTGAPITMFCYPFGDLDAETRKVVVEAGFLGARTTRQFVLGPQPDSFTLGTTLQVFPVPLRPRTARDFGAMFAAPFGPHGWHTVPGIINSARRGWLSFATALCPVALSKPGAVFHLWGHSWEVDHFGLWDELDVFLGILADLSSAAETNSGVIPANMTAPLVGNGAGT